MVYFTFNSPGPEYFTSTGSRPNITQVWFQILLVFSWTGTLAFPCDRSCQKVWSREKGSTVPSRVSPLILHTLAESSIINHQSSIWCLLTGSSPAIHFLPRGEIYTVNTVGSVPSLSGHTTLYLLLSTPSVHQHRSIIHKVARVKGAASLGNPVDQLMHGPLFSHEFLERTVLGIYCRKG